MSEELLLLGVTAAAVGTVHTLLGPDHYVPFVAMARAEGWSLRRTLAITLATGLAHVAGSVVLGGLGLALGWALGLMQWIESIRADVAGSLLAGIGIAYAAWGFRRALGTRSHSHWHTHADGTVHRHQHTHVAAHAHVHPAGARGSRATMWALFTVFVLGPCEPLIPVLMLPASRSSARGVVFVTAIFATCTVATMVLMTAAGYVGLRKLRMPSMERYAHAMAGLALFACGLAMRLGL